ncbi:hypothetical protein HX860_06315 [Marine Group I thaumarchaeote]|jgi:hypothetical protein|uniref:Roadblock/LC7 domain-containing protein n=1 Tax=Marine Group I thaumarchaeote TaxID=2511932 RepID=A0A7K4P263_9ARCH|nr:MAG: hypothetical protein DSN69_06430 [Nitrosopumilus sp. YT1]KPU81490.1 hypothetical protein JI55_00465 [Nitrosopumilus sp. PRT-SC01]NMI82741.1 hypothetical protein [Candidatus Nitrosopumilus sp. MTA1]NWJ20660.1 hypothetical protein [Marine Group I thaumarchaeote]NWJ28999.1 hypothetical protein [Marine Group I thaumarchaeote]
MLRKKTLDLLDIVQQILNLDSQMRFAAIIDTKGKIREAIMKTGKTSLESQKEEEHFCKQVAQRRAMRQEFNKTLGKVRYVHVEREKVSQMVIYTKRNIVYFSMEPEMAINTKIRLITKIKKITADL